MLLQTTPFRQKRRGEHLCREKRPAPLQYAGRRVLCCIFLVPALAAAAVPAEAALTARGTGGIGYRVLRRQALHLDQRIPAGEIQPALLVDLGDLDQDLVAHSHHVFHLIHPLDVQTADVD